MEASNSTNFVNEYYVLKHIFSYLSSKDLHNVANVCRDWQTAASRVLEENGLPQCYCLVDGHSIKPPINDKQPPKIILNFCANNIDGNFKKIRLCLNETFIMDSIPFYYIYVDHVIYSWKLRSEYHIGAIGGKSNVDNIYAFMLLSDMPGVNIECFHETEGRLINGESGKAVDVEDISKAKGLLYMVSSRIKNAHSQVIVDELIELTNSRGANTRTKLILAGGISHKLKKVEKSYKKTDILGVMFSGENVSVHADIFEPHKMSFEDFIKTFSDRVGPIPEGCVRLAFTFICINCRLAYRARIFEKYFPKVLLNGFFSYGEYYYNFKAKTSGGESEKKSLSKDYFYSNSAPFLIVTLRKARS